MDKKLVGGIIGLVDAIIIVGVSIATWNGAKYAWWQEIIGIVVMLGLAIVGFYLWNAGDEDKR